MKNAPLRPRTTLVSAVVLALALYAAGTAVWYLRLPGFDADYARYLHGSFASRALPAALPLIPATLVLGLVWGGLAHAPAALFRGKFGAPAWAAVTGALLLVGVVALGHLLSVRPGARDLAAQALSARFHDLDGYRVLSRWVLVPLQAAWYLLIVWTAFRVLLAARGRTGRALLAAGAGGVLLAFSLPGGPGSHGPSAEEMAAAPRPNVLIIASDSLRADRLGAYGASRPTSPRFDALSRRGALFENAFTAAGGTLESWATLLSGKYPPSHGLRYKFPSPEALDRFARDPDRLPARFSAAGYRTSVVSDWAGDCFRLADFGFEDTACPDVRRLDAFLSDTLLVHHPLLPLALSGTPLARLIPRLEERAGPLLSPDLLVDSAIDEMERARAEGRPFFSVFFSSVTHLPYAAPAPFAGRFTPADYSGPDRHRLSVSAEDFFFAADPPELGEEEREQIRAVYDSAVLAFDGELGRLLDYLEATGQDSDTIVVVTSDHGDDLFEPGTTLGHGRDFRGGDQGYRVPLLVAGPGVPAGRYAGIVRTADLSGTLLELAGLPGPAGADGRSLVPILAGEESGGRIAYAETTYLLAPPVEPGALAVETDGPALVVEPRLGEYFTLDPRLHDAVIASKLRMVRSDGWKLVRTPLAAGGSIDRLYDVQAETHHEKDVSAEHPEVARELARELEKASSGG
ncbi:MAG: sulfatase [Planctomycetes bacterium]|nr:sulfatase [Planctomycetota bacterium]